ncbi:MAG TPA: hypothetical protein ENL03_03690, partial [Phycisphaerae bacterium]|nr:hypothetical protein [Phycisphaerae bacterium]
MLRFDVYREGAIASDVNLAGAFLFGQDSIPVRADLACSNGQINCAKRTQGACGLAIVWDAGESGKFLLSTTRLVERRRPYNLNVELVRGRLTRLGQKIEEWGLFDFPSAEPLLVEFAAVKGKFIEALKDDDPAIAASKADDAMSDAVTLGEKMSLFHAEVLLNRRRGNSAKIFGCSVDLFSMTGDYSAKVKEAFDFISIPTPWKHT